MTKHGVYTMEQNQSGQKPENKVDKDHTSKEFRERCFDSFTFSGWLWTTVPGFGLFPSRLTLFPIIGTLGGAAPLSM